MRGVYLDYNASTPIAPEVVEAMSGSLKANFGNPSSSHWAGKPARAAVSQARARVAAVLRASPEEIVFTSGGSEANNHAIKGGFFALRWQARSHAGEAKAGGAQFVAEINDLGGHLRPAG